MRLTENQKETLIIIGKVLLIWGLVTMIALFAFGCKSVQTQTQIVYKDSTIVHTITDTAHITVTDTIHVEASKENESESNTEIQFGEGGGTYNMQTGEMTNVANLKLSSTVKELQKMNYTYKHIADSASAKCDSLFAANRDLQEQLERKENTKDITPRSGWDKFTTWWFIGSCIVLLLLLAYGVWRLYRKFYLHV